MQNIVAEDSQLQLLLDDFFADRVDVILVGLSTLDGFNIYTVSRVESCPADKIAALTSTMCAMGEAVSEQILDDEVSSVVVEAAGGKVLYAKDQFQEHSYVLSVAYTNSVSLGEARFLTQRLTKTIASLAI